MWAIPKRVIPHSSIGGGQVNDALRGDQKAVHVKMTFTCLSSNQILKVYEIGQGIKK